MLVHLTWAACRGTSPAVPPTLVGWSSEGVSRSFIPQLIYLAVGLVRQSGPLAEDPSMRMRQFKAPCLTSQEHAAIRAKRGAEGASLLGDITGPILSHTCCCM